MQEIVAINPQDCRIYTPPNSINAATFVLEKRTTMTQINAYLTFDGNCREAMTFYRDCLGGKLTLQTIQGSPMAAQWPAGVQQNILHASLVNGSLVLLGSDIAGRDALVNGNTISLSLNCSSEEEIKTFFSNLSAGGQVVHPLHEFFAGTMGTLTDRFEKDWLLYHERKVR